jgi:hypothetical protein
VIKRVQYIFQKRWNWNCCINLMGNIFKRNHKEGLCQK